MHRFQSAALAGLLFTSITAGWASAARPTATANYRLAGVLVAGDDHIGLLELPNGEQMLVRLNQSVPNGGRVIELDGQHARVAFQNGTLELTIDGAAREVMSSAARVVQSSDDQGHVHVRSVQPAVLAKELGQPGSATAAGREATQRRGRKDAGAELGRQFSRIVDLPPNARVLAVNERPVTSADAAIAEISRTLASGMPARLNLANGGDVQHRVYLLPAPR